MGSIEAVNTGRWYTGREMGYPLDRLGEGAAVWVDPVPNELYSVQLQRLGDLVGNPREVTPAVVASFREHQPALLAFSVMTHMRGIRLTDDGEPLADTEENRVIVLKYCPALLGRVYDIAHDGLRGSAWMRRAAWLDGLFRELRVLLEAPIAAGGEIELRMRELVYRFDHVDEVDAQGETAC